MGFEPTRAEPTRFQVWRLNHSATLPIIINIIINTTFAQKVESNH